MVRPLVELRVQRDDAAVGVLQLAVDALQLFLPVRTALERPQQLLVLLADFGERAGRPFRRERRGHARQIVCATNDGARRQQLLER